MSAPARLHTWGRGLAVGLAATALSRQVTAKIDPASWQRTSYSGATVQLTGGLDAAIGGLCGALSGRLGSTAESSAAAAAIVATLAGAGAGAIDDHFEARFPARGKGFHGHLGALKAGHVTSGLLKIIGVGAGAGVSALMLARSQHNSRRSWVSELGDVTVNTALIAGMANLINLLDLRPGRAVKVAGAGALAATTVTQNPAATGAVLGASIAAAPADLAGKTMLGDLGANALGAELGVALAGIPAKSARIALLAGIVTLTGLSEKVSFSQVIARTPGLRALDELGRPAVTLAKA